VGLFKRKKQKKFIQGGFRQYRTPSVFSGSKKLEPKKIGRPALTFSQFKKIVLASIVISSIWLFFFSSYFSIKDVFVEGNQLVSKGVIAAYASTGDNIFRFKINDTKNKLLTEHPEIKDVLIYKGIPNAIKIVVLEEDPKVVWQTNDKKYLISSQGKVAKEIPTDEFKDLPLIMDKKNIAVVPGQKLVSPNFIAFLQNINNQFFDQTNIKINHFEVQDTTFDLNIYTEAGFFVKLNTMRSSTKQLENLKTILITKRQDIHEYVDLRINGWGYYK
jgi:cell division septal protein FtsQ